MLQFPKPRGDSYDSSVKGFAERVDFLIGQLAISRRELCRRSGLSDSSLNVAIHHSRNDPESQPRVQAKTVIALQNYSQSVGRTFSLDWLLSGIGPPFLPHSTNVRWDPRFPSRVIAVQFARDCKLSNEAIAKAQAFEPSADLSPVSYTHLRAHEPLR